MIDIVALCKLAIEGGNKALEEYKRRKLSEAEKELLIAAAEKGEFRILSPDGVPSFIVANGNSFGLVTKGVDPAIAAKYHNAFESLCKRAFIRPDGGNLFRLTCAGFKKARELARKTDKKKANKH